jgi:hypothetical protein
LKDDYECYEGLNWKKSWKNNPKLAEYDRIKKSRTELKIKKLKKNNKQKGKTHTW